MHEIKKLQGWSLPHWRAENAIYFVTFRLAGSIPRSVIEYNSALHADILGTAKQANRVLSIWEIDELEDLHFRDMDLKRHDKKACFLLDDRIAEIVANALLHFQHKRYILFAWSIMPNHVHVVLQPMKGFELSEILQSWKRFSSQKANTILQKKGSFWQKEPYDHLIRDRADLLRCIEYTWMNSEKAGIKNWRWRGKLSPEEIDEAIAKFFAE